MPANVKYMSWGIMILGIKEYVSTGLKKKNVTTKRMRMSTLNDDILKERLHNTSFGKSRDDY